MLAAKGQRASGIEQITSNGDGSSEEAEVAR
jgi:hypothetical protein